MKDSKKAKEERVAGVDKLAILDSITELVVYQDRELRIMWANKAAASAVGKTVQQLIGKRCYEIWPQRTTPCVGCPIVEILKSGKPESAEITTPDGRVWLINGYPVRDEKDNLVGELEITMEITERKQAEAKIRAAAEEWRTTFDSITDLISINDRDFRLIRVNKAFADILKMKPAESIGKLCYEVVHGTKEPVPNCPHRKVIETKEPTTTEFFEPNLGIHLEVAASPMLNEKGEVVASVHVARNITEQKKAEAERRELERKAQVANRLASVGEMASGIAHEINNPLTSVVGFSELLMEKDLPEDLRKEVGIIHDGSNRVANIVKGLLTFARQQKPERTYTDINEIIESTLTLKKYSLVTSNIGVSTSLDAELPWTMADRGQLQQVFVNIIVNAETEMKQAHGRGKLIIKTEQIDNTIRISFKDDGPGIAKENIGKVFDPFFTTREVGEGTGLGLSLSHGIITEHNGRIYAESETGRGAIFIIELPVVAEEEEKIETVDAAEEAGRALGARILVVDDEPTILAFLKKVLVGEGYDVATASSGEEALGMIKNERYSLILCDIKLPGLSGAETYEQIGKVAPSLQKRVMFITGDVIGAGTEAFLKKARSPYVTKPFDIAKLKEEVRRVIISAG